MRFKRYMTGVAIAALLAGSAHAQNPGQSPIAAGNLNPASEEAPARPVAGSNSDSTFIDIAYLTVLCLSGIYLNSKSM